MTAPQPATFLLPDIGEGLAEAEIVRWLVAAGDAVTLDQPVVVVETAKAQVELPTPFAGTVLSLGAEEGDVVPVGGPLLTVVAGSGVAAEDAVGAGAVAVASSAAPPAPAVPVGRRVLASPSTRRLARELGVALEEVTPTGPSGRVVEADVRAAADAPGQPGLPGDRAGAPPDAGPRPLRLGRPEDRVVPLRGLRRQIAASMTAAWAVPHVTEFREVDATGLLDAQRRLRARQAQPERLTVLPILVRACAAALRRHPRFNASLDLGSGVIVEHGRIDIGIATSSPAGLLVPVIRDADRLSVAALAAAIASATASARSRTSSAGDLADGTFTVTNFGSFGTWLGTPVIRPPEAAIAGFGRISDRVVAVDGVPSVRKTLPIVVAADHRLNDGADLAAFVDDIAVYCADPVLLLET